MADRSGAGVVAAIDLEVFGEQGFAAEDLHVDLGLFFDLHDRAAFAIVDVRATLSLTRMVMRLTRGVWQAMVMMRTTSMAMLSAVLTTARPWQHGQSSYTLRLRLGRMR